MPLVTERTIIDDLQARRGKRERWQRIIQEAAEQCGRGRVPLLLPGQMLRQRGEERRARAARCGSFPGRASASLTLTEALARCNFPGDARIELFVGPEGGFTDAEIDWAQRHDVRPVTLGARDSAGRDRRPGGHRQQFCIRRARCDRRREARDEL